MEGAGVRESGIREKIWTVFERTVVSHSPGDIHFRIYDDITDNGILDLQSKISIRNAFAPLLFWFLSFMPRDHTLLVKEHQRNMWNKRKMAFVSATQRKICRKWIQRLCFSCILNGVIFEFLQISGMKYSFLVLKKLLRDTRVNFLVVYSNKIHKHDSLVHKHGLWKSVKCVISAPLLVHCLNVSWIVCETDLWFRLIWSCSCCKALHIFISS